VIAGMLFFCKDIGPAPGPAGAKRMIASTKRMPADRNFILKPRFKKTFEFFSDLVDSVAS
jgi:hypothetical protein